MRVAAYIRVSDESQIEGYSLEAQRTEIGRWCERRGHELVAVYAEEGVSAHSERIERRPELMRLLSDGCRVFDLAVVHTLDRSARNVSVQRQALHAWVMLKPVSPRSRKTSTSRRLADD